MSIVRTPAVNDTATRFPEFFGRGWAKMPNLLIDHGDRLDLTRSELAVVLVLVRHGGKDGRAYPKMETIARKARISKGAVVRAIKGLEGRELLRVTRARAGARQAPNEYDLAPLWERLREVVSGVSAEPSSTTSEFRCGTLNPQLQGSATAPEVEDLREENNPGVRALIREQQTPKTSTDEGKKRKRDSVRCDWNTGGDSCYAKVGEPCKDLPVNRYHNARHRAFDYRERMAPARKQFDPNDFAAAWNAHMATLDLG